MCADVVQRLSTDHHLNEPDWQQNRDALHTPTQPPIGILGRLCGTLCQHQCQKHTSHLQRCSTDLSSPLIADIAVAACFGISTTTLTYVKTAHAL